MFWGHRLFHSYFAFHAQAGLLEPTSPDVMAATFPVRRLFGINCLFHSRNSHDPPWLRRGAGPIKSLRPRSRLTGNIQDISDRRASAVSTVSLAREGVRGGYSGSRVDASRKHVSQVAFSSPGPPATGLRRRGGSKSHFHDATQRYTGSGSALFVPHFVTSMERLRYKGLYYLFLAPGLLLKLGTPPQPPKRKQKWESQGLCRRLSQERDWKEW